MSKRQTKKTKSTVVFQNAVTNTAEIAKCMQPGLQALGKYSKLISLNGPCEGSVDIDNCVTNIYPDANRWDYTFGYNNQAYFVEVHSAETGEVSTVLKKLKWLQDWLHTNAPELNALKAARPFYWIQSGRYAILPNSPQARRVAQAGIKPIPKLVIP